MKPDSRKRLFIAAALAACALPGAGAFAQAPAWPAKPIRMVVPFPAGGSVDAVARGVAELMSRKLGQPVIVDNKAGANAAIGTSEVARSNPDGYTILFGSDSGLVLSPLLYKKLPYDVERDFTAVGLAVNVPLALTVHPDLPIKTVGELIAYAKANPGKLNYSSTGTGSLYHLTTELFSQKTGIEMTHIPFTGGAPALTALLGHQVDLLFSVVGSPLQYVKAGKLRALAVLTPERLAALPDVPTLQQSGVSGIDATARYGIVAPRKTPAAVIEQLNAAVNFALADPGYRERFTAEGYLIPKPHKAVEFDQMLAHDRAMWRGIIESRHLVLD